MFVTCVDGVYVDRLCQRRVRKVHDQLRNPHGVAVTPDGSHAYVTDTDHDQVLVIDTASLRAVSRVGVGPTPWGPSRPTAQRLRDQCQRRHGLGDRHRPRGRHRDHPLGSGTTTDATRRSPAQPGPDRGRVSPDGHIWVACNASSSLVVIDPASNAVSPRSTSASATSPPGSPLPDPRTTSRPAAWRLAAGREPACAQWSIAGPNPSPGLLRSRSAQQRRRRPRRPLTPPRPRAVPAAAPRRT